jgi:hypothetical protein
MPGGRKRRQPCRPLDPSRKRSSAGWKMMPKRSGHPRSICRPYSSRQPSQVSADQVSPASSSQVPTICPLLDQPYLQGRAFVFCSQFVTALDTKTVEQFVQQALAVLHGAHVAAAVKLSAVRALSKYALQLPRGNTLTLPLRSCFRHPSNANLMQQYSAASLSAVIPLLAHTSESTLVLLLETLEYAVRPNAPDVTDNLYSKVAQSVLQVWTRSANGLWMRCIPYVLSDTKWQNLRLAWQ